MMPYNQVTEPSRFEACQTHGRERVDKTSNNLYWRRSRWQRWPMATRRENRGRARPCRGGPPAGCSSVEGEATRGGS